MEHTELNQKFEAAGKKTRDFIRWAEGKGVKVYDATVCRQRKGSQGITEPWHLSYLWFFEEMKAAGQ